MKLPDLPAMRKLIERELEKCDAFMVEAFAPRLIDPYSKILKWEYGENEEFPAWVVADMGERNVFVAYCLGGHGALGSPWGLIFKQDDNFGMDNGWYSSLRELLIEWGIGKD